MSKDNYATKSINLLQKAEVPSDCTVLVVGGPTRDYPAARSRCHQEICGGRRARAVPAGSAAEIGRPTIADNDALTSLLQSWGVTCGKDLMLDLNPMGQLAGLGPQVALVTSYDSHPIVNEMKGTATGFPLSRSLDIKNTDKTTVQKLFDSSDSQPGNDQLEFAERQSERPQEQERPADDRRRRHLQHRQGKFAGTLRSRRQFLLGGELVSSLSTATATWRLNAMNWLSSDEDLISIRPKPPEDRASP